ncbi:MAG: hypothetical protein N2595_04085 [bacterium]|nr:hypothetical protein [bacterium]
MRKTIHHLLMLPRSIRVRMMSGFALMGVLPMLVSVYVLTNQIAPVRQGVPWMCVMILLSVVLVLAGSHLMRESVWSVINVARTADELLRQAKEGADAREVVRLERLLCYMEDQLAAARRALQVYRDVARRETRSYRLPPLIPGQLVRARLEEELARSRREGSMVTVFAWETAVVSAEEERDETHVPLWLQEVLRKSGAVLDGVGRVRAGYWVGVARGLEAEQVPGVLTTMKRVALTHGIDAAMKVWVSPREEVDVREVMRGIGEERG